MIKPQAFCTQSIKPTQAFCEMSWKLMASVRVRLLVRSGGRDKHLMLQYSYTGAISISSKKHVKVLITVLANEFRLVNTQRATAGLYNGAGSISVSEIVPTTDRTR